MHKNIINPMITRNNIILSIAIPSPLRHMFDYLPPASETSIAVTSIYQPGMRIEVPFGPRKLIGIIESIKSTSSYSSKKIKTASRLPDRTPVIPNDIMQLCRWAAVYYHYSLGKILSQVLPKDLRKGKPATQRSIRLWQVVSSLNLEMRNFLKRAPKQLKAIEFLNDKTEGLSESELKEMGISRTILHQLEKKKLIVSSERKIKDKLFTEFHTIVRQQPLFFNNDEQTCALHGILESKKFHPILLGGITGSGKTEVYLQAVESILKAGKQALVLIPEISLTPQTIQQFRNRFAVPVTCLHSGLSDSERLQGWLAASQENIGVLISTRSGIFTPLPKLGLIIVDEEHDDSYKQQDTLRYNARDLAIYRAKLIDCPIVLGSATPSLESLMNVRSGRYNHLELKNRAGQAKLPTMELLDLRQQTLQDGFATSLIDLMHSTLSKGEQVMIFLNRRGYSPALICHDCGLILDCPNCDAHLTLHRHPPRMHCHHCNYQAAIPWVCSKCHGKHLQSIGQGTEKIEQILNQLFPKQLILRIDKDSTRKKNSLSNMLDIIKIGKPCILLGTQMLAKGHHFPNVTLVAIINADAGLFSSDFRGLEKTGQLILQVAGRSGRGDKPGHVVIQTHNPQHPALQLLVTNQYIQFANTLLTERHHLKLPPKGFLALIRTETTVINEGKSLLWMLKNMVFSYYHNQDSFLRILGPIAAPMEKRQGRYRHQLLIQSNQRSILHHTLDLLTRKLELLKLPRTIRWSLDVDPQEII